MIVRRLNQIWHSLLRLTRRTRREFLGNFHVGMAKKFEVRSLDKM